MKQFFSDVWATISHPLSIILLVALYTSAIAGVVYSLLLIFTLQIASGVILLTILALFFHVWGLKA